MELIILGGIALVVLLFNVAGIAFVFGRGGPVWDRQAQTEAKWMFGGILVAALVIGAVWFGVAALLSIWPFWLALGVAAWAFFAVGEWRARKHERKAAPTGELYGKVTTARAQGREEPWMRGVHVPPSYQPQQQPKSGGLFGWLDRL